MSRALSLALLPALPVVTVADADATEELLATCPRRSLYVGEILLSPARNDYYVYRLLHGRLSLRESPGGPPLALIEPGEYIGDYAALMHIPHKHFAIAEQHSVLQVIDEDTFLALLAANGANT